MKKIIFLFSFFIVCSPLLLRGVLKYELSYLVKGTAKGHILLIFPYRIYYTASASADFSVSPKGDGYIFKLDKIRKTGYMMRTLGFSGRSLAVMTAEDNLEKSKIISDNLIKDFQTFEPEYAKFIRRIYWNSFFFKKVKHQLTFLRSKRGVNKNIFYNLWLKRSHTKKPLKINFNIYRIMMEIVKAFNHPFLPEETDIQKLTGKTRLNWYSNKIDFSDILARSAKYAAGIFNRISPLKQKKTFRIKYSAEVIERTFLKISGVAEPEVSIWGQFLIKKFIRHVRIRLSDQLVISDSFRINVSNKSGKGGTFEAALILID